MRFRFVIAAALAGLGLSTSPAVAQDTAALRVEANGFRGAGTAIARVYAVGDNVMGEPRWARPASIADGGAFWAFALPPGRYAVVVFEDLNGNGRLDHNMIGMPAEPLGFSGQFRLSLFSGLPSFEKLHIVLPVRGATIHIRM